MEFAFYACTGLGVGSVVANKTDRTTKHEECRVRGHTGFRKAFSYSGSLVRKRGLRTSRVRNSEPVSGIEQCAQRQEQGCGGSRNGRKVQCGWSEEGGCGR